MAIFDAAPMNLISDFTGSDENPLSEGGNWAMLNTAVPTRSLQRVSNEVTGQATAFCAAYWTVSNFGPDLQAYFTLTDAGTCGIVVRIQGEGGSGTWDGYLVGVGVAASSIDRVDNGTRTTISGGGPAYANGDKVGIRVEGTGVQLWRQLSGSSDWISVLAAGDAVYPSAGKIGLHASAASGVFLNDFYAGTINAVPVA